ncbi:MAG: class I SAM-dependent methyltransferase [Moraxellaceae bacterium]|nr:class I SAM-dependent methyltransferase [Moraxellaceae bacterium]
MSLEPPLSPLTPEALNAIDSTPGHLPVPPDAMARKARFWDRIARRYAADPVADPAGYEATLLRVQGLLGAHQNVLELGCGTGSTALRLAPYAGQWLGTDISAGMITIAHEKLAATPVPQLRFALADAEAPAFGSGRWDVVTAFNLLHLVDDLEQTLNVALQALKPGGLFIAKTPCLREMNPVAAWLLPLALPLMRAIGAAPQVRFFNSAALEAALRQRGFDIEAVERHGRRGKDIRVFIVARKPLATC